MEQSQMDSVELIDSLRKTIYNKPEKLCADLDNKLWSCCRKKFNFNSRSMQAELYMPVLSDVSWEVEQPVSDCVLNIILLKNMSYVYGG